MHISAKLVLCHLGLLLLAIHPFDILAAPSKKGLSKKSKASKVRMQKDQPKESFEVFVAPTAAAPPASSDRIGIPTFLASSSQSPSQGLVEFYKAVRSSLVDSEGWESIQIEKQPTFQESDSYIKFYGNIPIINRADFRASLAKKRRHQVDDGSKSQETRTPQRVVAIQQYLDQLRVPAGLVVDCSHSQNKLLRGCAIYYYDRVKQKVSASVVKLFSAGTRDATAWASPLVRNLENGLAHAQRAKDEKIIDELMAKEDLDDQSDTSGHLSAFVSTSNVRVSGTQASFNKNLVGFGIEAGMMLENVGAYLFASRSNWTGTTGQDTLSYRKAQATDIGMGMNLRANALDQLLWGLQIAVSRQTLEFSLVDSQGASNNESKRFVSDGVNMSISPSMGVLVSDLLEISLGPVWGWYSESNRELSDNLEKQESPTIGKTSTLGLRFRVGLSF